MGLVDRPLCLALIFGFFTSDWALALPLGIILELLWLDVLELGSIVPPMGSLSFLLLFPLGRHFGWDTPGPLVLPLVLVTAAAYAAALLERNVRIGQNVMVGRVHAYCAGASGLLQQAELSPGQAVLIAVFVRALWQFLLYVVSFCLVLCLLFLMHERDLAPQLPVMTWPMLYAAALMGAVLSLRTRQAYAMLTAGLCVLGLLLFMNV